MSVNKARPSFDDRIKPKNILALNEKVAAIRRYEVDPVYKKVGRMFNCSPDQIKRIIKQKDDILAEWDNRTKKSAAPTSHEIKSVKISFLGKAVHEWIRRIMYYTDFNLTDTLIVTMSLEFSKVLGLVKFHPHRDWIANFRATYNLPDANTKTMTIGYQESHSVQIRDILRHVKQVCDTGDVKLEDQYNPETNMNTNTATVENLTEESENQNATTDFYCHELIIKEEDEICQPSCSSTKIQGNEISVQNTVFSAAPETQTINVTQMNMIQAVSKTPEPEPEPQPEPQPEIIAIYSHEAAISCVKLLEEFALLKENFRLIGLIERLEEALNERRT